MAYNRESYLRQNEAILAYQKEYYNRTRDQRLAYQKQYDQQNAEKISQRFQAKKYYKKHKKKSKSQTMHLTKLQQTKSVLLFTFLARNKACKKVIFER